MYLAWGATREFSSSNLDDYPGFYIISNLTKYTSYKGSSSYDSATKLLGNSAATPDQDDWIELVDNCDVYSHTDNGINCLLFEGPNGNQIIIPCGGTKYYNGNKAYVGEAMYYWSSEFKARYYADESVAAAIVITTDLSTEELRDYYYYNHILVRPVKR